MTSDKKIALLSSRIFLLSGSILLMILASACANNGSGSGAGSSANGKDIVTASDESEIHKRARLRLELALGYFEKGQTTVALDQVKQAIVIEPNFQEAFNLRGLIYMRLNDYVLAEESFNRAISLQPNAASVQHNYALMLCQQGRYADAYKQFSLAIDNPQYTDRARSLLSQGVCQIKEGNRAAAEKSLMRAFEIDAANPATSYYLADVLYQRGDYVRAQFYIRRVNNGDYAGAESLWLGIKNERKLNNPEAVSQLGLQLRKRFPQSKETAAYLREAFDD